MTESEGWNSSIWVYFDDEQLIVPQASNALLRVRDNDIVLLTKVEYDVKENTEPISRLVKINNVIKHNCTEAAKKKKVRI